MLTTNDKKHNFQISINQAPKPIQSLDNGSNLSNANHIFLTKTPNSKKLPPRVGKKGISDKFKPLLTRVKFKVKLLLMFQKFREQNLEYVRVLFHDSFI